MDSTNTALLDGPTDFEDLAKQAGRASELLKALSHETRLLILYLLSKSEKSVTELERKLNLPQAAVSQQLARLRIDRLVATRREGRLIYYRISDEQALAVIDALYNIFCLPCQGTRSANDLR